MYSSKKSGLHRTGLTAVNAFSRRLRVEVERDGNRWLQEYQQGEPVADLCVVGRTERTGTAVTLWPEPTIFRVGSDCRYSRDVLATRLRELAFLNRGVTFRLIDLTADPPQKDRFHIPDGPADYVRFLDREKEAAHPHLFHFTAAEAGDRVEVALQWTRSEDELVRTYCNDAFTANGGTHQTGFRAGLTPTLLRLLRERGRMPVGGIQDIGARLRRGLTAVVVVNLDQPMFESQLQNRLNSPEAKLLVSRPFARHFRAFLRRHPKDADAIVGKMQSNLSAP
jgi:DNA gyrase subunit B